MERKIKPNKKTKERLKKIPKFDKESERLMKALSDFDEKPERALYKVGLLWKEGPTIEDTELVKEAGGLMEGIEYMEHTPSFGPRAWLIRGKKYNIMTWDCGNGWCQEIQRWKQTKARYWAHNEELYNLTGAKVKYKIIDKKGWDNILIEVNINQVSEEYWDN